MRLKTERSYLDRITVAKLGFLYGLTIDARADATATVADSPTLRSPYDQGVYWGDFGRGEAHIAASALAYD
jgi:hypothetical protein